MIPMWSQQKRAMAHHPSDHSGFDLERKKPTKVERHQNHLPRTMPTKARSYIWYNADIQGERERERSSSDRPSACQTVWQTRTTTRRDHTPDDNQRGMEQGRPKGNEPVRKTVPTLAVFVHNLLLCVAPASFVTAPPCCLCHVHLWNYHCHVLLVFKLPWHYSRSAAPLWAMSQLVAE